MHMFRRLSLPWKIAIFGGAGIAISGLLMLSLLTSFSGASGVALASGNRLQPFTITSPNFRDGGPLSPRQELNQRGCTGSNIAPTLNWKNAPAGTQSFVMLMNDFDAAIAGGVHHWIVYNIPATAHQIKGNSPFTEGTTTLGLMSYGGPCPPATGETHHYQFLLYAINIPNIGPAGLNFNAVMSAVQGHVLGATSTIGLFHLPL